MVKKTQTEFQQETDERFAKHEAMFDKIMAELQKITTNQDQRMVGPLGFASGGIKPYLKLHFPRFGGEDPKGWLYQAEQYFEFQRIETEDQESLGPLSMRIQRKHTVASYQEAFEKISHQVDGLPEIFLVGCFIEGLNEEIRLEVKLKTPKNLTQAIGMTLLVEEKLNLQRRGYTSQRLSALSAPGRSTTTQGILGPGPNQRLALPAPNPVRRDVSEVENEETLCDTLEQNSDDSHAVILFHAISGSINPQTLRLPSIIKNKEVVVLIDGGSTHNFIDQALADRFGLVLETDTLLKVVVGNREHVTCTGRIRDLTIVIQEYVISTNFFMLPVAACPIVLGVQWLKTLGPVEMDYE
nr:hypothetical protein [Tanacetum cinerariifolium]